MNQLGYNLLVRFVYPFLLILLCWNPLVAQPQYSASNQVGGGTPYPLNHAYSKSQWIYGPNYFHKGGLPTNAAATYGKISQLYFKLGDLVDSLNSFTDFTIKIGQSVGVDTSWSNTNYDTSLLTVFHKSDFAIKAVKRDWISFKLPNTFVYNPNKSLVVELSVTSGQGVQLQPINTNSSTTILGETTTKSGYTTNESLVNIGFDLIEWESNNTGIAELLSPTLFCAGTHDIYVKVINSGSNPVDSLKLNWSLDGGAIQSSWYTNRLDTFGSSNGNWRSVKLGTDTFTTNAARKVLVWTDLPNNVTDTTNDDDTLSLSIKPALNGNYTIGSSASDYQTISAATSDLQLFGVCGPVKFELDSGTYVERLVLNNIKGTSSTNTIVFDGRKSGNCIIENDAKGVLNQQTVLLNAVSFVTIKNITIRAKSGQYSIGIQLIKTNNINIVNCNIELPQLTKKDNIIGIAGTGSLTNAQKDGLAGNSNTFINNHISGGSIAVFYTGFDTSLYADDVTFCRNTFSGFDKTGLIIRNVNDLVIDRNSIIGNDSSANGITIDYVNTLRFNANSIQKVNQALNLTNINRHKYTNSTRSIVGNNMLNADGLAPYGILTYNLNHLNFYHNSVQSNGGYAVVFGKVDSTNVINNVFHNLGGKSVFYANDSGGFNNTNTLNNNNYFTRFSTSGYAVEFGKSQYKSVKNWFKTDTAFNKNSFDQLPGFVSTTDLHIDSSGNISGKDVGFTRDFDNDLRCNIFPTIGADQYTPGFIADTAKPDFICQTGCLKYNLPAPKGHSNASYGTDWTYDSISVKTASGYSSSNFKLTTPRTTNGWIEFCPDSTEVDSAFILFLIFRDLNGKHCFSTFTSYVLVGQEPDATFTIERNELCLGDSLTITSQNHTADDSVIYTLGDGQKEIEASFDYLYDTIGIYTITKYFKSFGCMDSSSKTVRVGTTKGANIVQGHPFKRIIRKGNIRDPDKLCTEDTTYYQIFPPKTIDRYGYDSLWRIKWVSLSTFDETPVHDTLTVQPDKFNNFRIRVFPRESYINDTLVLKARLVSLLNSVCDTTLTRYITLRRSPHVGFTATPICLDETATFKDTTVNNSVIVDWFWNFDDGSISQLQQDTHTYSTTGKYKITLTTLSTTGCHGYYAREVEVHPRSEVDFITDDSCENQTITFMDTSTVFGTGHFYLWDYGDGKFGIGRTSQHNFDSIGIYATTLYIDNGGGCIDSVTKRVNILKKPVANFTLLTKCSNVPVKFISSSSDTVTSTYKWNFTALDSSSDQDPSHQFDNSPNTIRLIVTNNGSCSDTISKSIQLDTVPVLSFSSTYVTQQQVRFTPSDSTNLTLKWYFGDGDSSSDISPTHTYPTQINRYEVRCIVQNDLRCTTEVTDSVTIGNDALNGLNKSKLKVSPNPFNKSLSIDIENIKSEILSIQVVDLLGKQVRVQTVAHKDEIMVYPLNTFTPGLYVLKVQTQETTYSLMVLYSNDL